MINQWNREGDSFNETVQQKRRTKNDNNIDQNGSFIGGRDCKNEIVAFGFAANQTD